MSVMKQEKKYCLHTTRCKKKDKETLKKMCVGEKFNNFRS